MSLRLLRRPPLFRCNSAFPLTATPRRFFSGQDSSAEQLPPFNPKSAFKVTQPPNPQWDIGEGLSSASPNAEEWIEDLNQGWKSWDLGETPRREAYELITSAVVPRPIAFVASTSEDGIQNLAPMSYFNAVSANPPLLSISFTLGKNRPKDSRENILSTKQFTVNIISEPFIEAANASAVEAPAHIDEWLVSGLTPEPSVSIAVPRVQESAVSFECELFKHIDIAAPESDEPTTTLILGLIKRVHVCKAVLRDDGRTVDPGKLRPVARLDGGLYSRMGEAFELPRPSWRAWKDKIEEMHRTTTSR